MGDKPVFRVGVAGLDARELRLMGIVFRHSQYNRYEFRLADVGPVGEFDILIANVTASQGQRAITEARERATPIIAALPRGASAAAGGMVPAEGTGLAGATGAERHSIALERLPLQLLPVLNRVVEAELLAPEASPREITPERAQEEEPRDVSAPIPAPTRRSEWTPSASAGAEPARDEQVLAGPAYDAPADLDVTPTAAMPAEDMPAQDAPAQDAPAQDAPAEDTHAEDTQTEDTQTEDTQTEEPHAEEPHAEEVHAEEVHAEEAHAEEAHAEEAHAEEAHAEEAHAEEPHADRPEDVHEDAGAASPAGSGDTGRASRSPGELPSPLMAAAGASEPTRPPADERPARGQAGAAARSSNLVPFPVGEGTFTPRLRVLVVDDSPTVRRQLTVAFDRLGLGCETVDSAARALERLEEQHFDLALIDVVMPDRDGYRLTREIKRDRRLRQMPVIILTSRSSPFDLARGALSGCDAYLTKPVPFRALESAVAKQLRRSLGLDDLTGMMRLSDSQASHPEARTESRVARLFRR